MVSKQDDPVPDHEIVNAPCVLTSDQSSRLKTLQAQFSHILTKTPGRTSLVELSIDTGDSPPFQSYPYRLPVKLMQPVRTALDLLLSL